jgi:hypothetical protein
MVEEPKTDARRLRDMAERCRRLARQVTDRDVAERLGELARDFDRQAAAAEHREPEN